MPRLPNLPVGWHPDPYGDGGLYRYWNGAQWGAETRPAPEPPRRRPKKRSFVFSLTFASFLVAVTVIVVTMMNSDVTKVTIGATSVEFSQDEIERAQPTMERRLEVDKENARTSATEDATTIDIGGQWTPAAGGDWAWIIYQYGEQVVVEERSTSYGITGTGQGRFDGTLLAIDYVAVNGMRGSAQLQLVDGSALTGVITSAADGMSRPLELYRG